MPSTFKAKDGTVKSRIQPIPDPGAIVTDPQNSGSHDSYRVWYCQHERQEHLGKGPSALINLAHPDFREELIREATEFKIWRRTTRSPVQARLMLQWGNNG